MKLDDVLEAVSISKDLKTKFLARLTTPRRKGWAATDTSGVYSVVYLGDKNVTKVNQWSDVLRKDPYFQYASFVYANHLAESNPYFPRISAIKLARAPGRIESEDANYHIVMERLIPTATIPIEDLMDSARRMFREDIVDREFGRSNNSAVQRNVIREMLGAFMQNEYITQYRGGDNITDPQLTEAMDIIQKLIDENDRAGEKVDLYWDLHSSNFMFRLDGEGFYQLVITDPLGSKST